jgi:hypothetical protein
VEGDPREVIGAVFGADQADKPVDHLGTGSIIGDGTIVLTGDHVIRDYPGTLRIAVIIGNQVQHFPMTVLESDWRRDLALCESTVTARRIHCACYSILTSAITPIFCRWSTRKPSPRSLEASI